MSKIDYLVDEAGKQKAVVIDSAQHGTLWEDLHDALLVEQREDDPRKSLEEVEAGCDNKASSGRVPRIGVLANSYFRVSSIAWHGLTSTSIRGTQRLRRRSDKFGGGVVHSRDDFSGD